MRRIYLMLAVMVLCGACSDRKNSSYSKSPPPAMLPSSSGSGAEPPAQGTDTQAPLEAPAQLSAEISDKGILYRWSPVQQASGYVVYYSTEPGVVPGDESAQSILVRASQVTLSDVEPDTTYYAVVTALDRSGRESAASNQVTAAPPPEQVFQLNFDEMPVTTGYAAEYHSENLNLSIEEEDSSHYLRATYTPSEIGSPRLTFMRDFKKGRAYTLSYQVLFEEGFDFAKGGKLPGLGPKVPVTGCESSLLNGWSVRLMWLPKGRVGIYYYDQEPDNACGKTAVAPDFQFEPGRWYDISIYVKLNSQNEPNGHMALYIDGRHAVSRKDVRLRAVDEPDSEIQRLLFSTFFGGKNADWAPQTVVHSRFNHFEVHRGFHIRALEQAD